jgi:predicted NBD/HSP70 family sugar kinase
MRILNLVKEHQRISRTDLAKITDLSAAAVSRIVQNLIDEGSLLETDYGDSAGGRKPVFIEVNPKAGYIIGVDFERSRANAGVFNFCGEIQFQYQAPIVNRNFFGGLYQALDACIQFLDQRSGGISLLGIGLGVRGLLDKERETICYSDSFSWSNIPLCQILRDRYRVPVFMDLNARLAALGEWSIVYRRSVLDLSYVTTSWGICTGVISGGKLFYGGFGSAGEVGISHLCSDTAEGGMKTLEQLCGGQMFLEKCAENWDNPCTEAIREICEGKKENLRLENVVEAVNNGDPYCRRLTEEAGHILGIGLVNITAFYNPQVLVIGGQLTALGDLYLQPAFEVLRQPLFLGEFSKPRLEVSVLGDRASMYGASLLVFQNLFPNSYGPEVLDKTEPELPRQALKEMAPAT